MKGIIVATSLALAVMFGGCSSGQTEVEGPVQDVPPPHNTPEQPVAVRPFGFHGTLPGQIELERWQTPESCSECHNTIYTEWQGTMHSNAGRDPLFLGMVRTLRDRVSSELERTELRTCTRCHSAAAHLSAGAVDTFSDLQSIIDLDERGGNFCGLCHAMVGSQPRDGGYEVEPGTHAEDLGIIQGPREDARDDGHQVAFNQLLTRAAFCGTCHDQSHAFSGVPILTTYSEWRDGPYNTGQPETTVVCQDCHMRQLPGSPSTAMTDRPNRPGRSAPTVGEISPERPHVWVHNFVGANTLMPGVLIDQVYGAMAAERLASAVTLEINAPEQVAPGGSITIEVRVTNSGAGHSVPTGMTGIRQMWLELRVVAPAAGITVLESGLVDEQGSVDEDARTFGTVYGDADGAPVFTFTRAAQVLREHRIGPRETVTERFEIAAPQGGGSELEVHARIRYRPASPEMVEAVMPDIVETIEITDMAEAEATITITQ